MTFQDIIALIIQALGGASAAAAVNQGKSAKPGGDTMLAGIIFQTGERHRPRLLYRTTHIESA